LACDELGVSGVHIFAEKLTLRATRFILEQSISKYYEKLKGNEFDNLIELTRLTFGDKVQNKLDK
jgi:hypothetical protein